jgi:hypothetical protein
VLGCLPVEVFYVDVVGEMVAKLWEQAERCLYVKDSGLRIYDLILSPTDSRVHLTVRLEEATGQFSMM